MKLYLSVFLFVMLQFALFPRDITTLSGTAYKDVKVLDVNAAEITIYYPDKDKPELTIMKPIPFTDLPDEIRKEFKYDPAKAEAFEKARKALEDKIAEAKKQRESELVKPVVVDVPLIDATVQNKPVESDIAPREKNGPADEGADNKRQGRRRGNPPGEGGAGRPNPGPAGGAVN